VTNPTGRNQRRGEHGVLANGRCRQDQRPDTTVLLVGVRMSSIST